MNKKKTKMAKASRYLFIVSIFLLSRTFCYSKKSEVGGTKKKGGRGVKWINAERLWGGRRHQTLCEVIEPKQKGEEKKRKREIESANASPFIGGRRRWFSAGYRTPESTKETFAINPSSLCSSLFLSSTLRTKRKKRRSARSRKS